MKALNQPESWWGWHGYSQPQPLSIVQIMQSGTLTPRIAALLWVAMERGSSMVLAADPPGAGKTTILTALLAFAPPEASVYFTRGWGETFRLPPAPRPDEPPTYIMINEISDHLPVYSWGPYVARAFELMADGFSMLSTMHADTVDGVIEQLTDENDVAPANIGHLSFVVPLFVGVRDGARIRRVSEVAVLEPLGQSYDRHSVVRWHDDDDRFEVLANPAQINAAARRVRMSDGEFLQAVAEREQLLEGLFRENLVDMEDVQSRVAAFRQHAIDG